MEQLGNKYPKFNQLPLNQVTMPGSHDTGMNPGIFPAPGPDDFNPNDAREYQLVSPFIDIIAAWGITQNFPIWQQLLAGSRYFDLRVAPMISTTGTVSPSNTVCQTELYTLHGVYGQPVESTLSEFQSFLQQNPKEIIILDFQHFYSMTQQSYQTLNSLINQYLSEWLVPTSVPMTTTVGELLANNHRVLVTIGDDNQWSGKSLVSNNNNISYFQPAASYWPRANAIVSNWFNTTDLTTLQTDSNQEVTQMQSNYPSTLWVLQEVLTPDTQSVLQSIKKGVRPSVNPSASLKGLESNTPAALTGWLQTWTSQGAMLNIVMTNYVNTQLSQSIINTNIPRIS